MPPKAPRPANDDEQGRPGCQSVRQLEVISCIWGTAVSGHQCQRLHYTAVPHSIWTSMQHASPLTCFERCSSHGDAHADTSIAQVRE